MSNGINLDQFDHSWEDIRREPQRGYLRFQVAGDWIHGTRNQLAVRTFPPLAIDEIPNFGGENSAPAPSEYLLSAVAGCFAVGLQQQLARAGVRLERFSLEVSGGVDWAKLEGLSPGDGGLDQLFIRATIQSNAELELLEALAEEAVRLSPVLNSLKTPASVVILEANS